MFTHCLSCKTKLPQPGVLDRPLPGDRIAYDPERGRLWSICRTCRSWSLAPIEERWETVDELEGIVTRKRVVRGRARTRLLSRTDNISLFRFERLDIVRIGDSNRLEETAWRYGRDVRKSWLAAGSVGADGLRAGSAVTLGAAIVGGVLTRTVPWRYTVQNPTEVRRWLRFGDQAWSGHQKCRICGFSIRRLSFFDRKILMLHTQADEHIGPALSRQCPSCRDALEGGLQLTGLAAEQTLRRVLAYQHLGGASRQDIEAATNLIEREGQTQLVGVLLRLSNQLRDLPAVGAIALEVAVNEIRESRLLRLEMGSLKQYWREAEALASIVDGELTWMSGVERLRLRAVGGL